MVSKNVFENFVPIVVTVSGIVIFVNSDKFIAALSIVLT